VNPKSPNHSSLETNVDSSVVSSSDPLEVDVHHSSAMFNGEQQTTENGVYGIYVEQEQPFQSFVYNQYDASYISLPAQPAYGPQYQSPTSPMAVEKSSKAPSPDDNVCNHFEDEPPLLTELGINPHQILHKTLAVLNPRRDTDAESLRDTDLAGPLVLVLAFGGFLLLSGKVHFGCIYGIAVLGCLAIFVLVNLMADSGASVAVGVTVSVLGYCLLPMVVLAGISILVSLQDVLGMALTTLAVFWCALSASKLFVTALDMRYQQPLVAYPCALLYAALALLTIF